LSDLRLTTLPAPEERRRVLRDALASLVPGWQPLAENILGADARIDWVGRDNQGRCVLAMVGRGGDDLALVARGLAQRDWVAARLPDWIQLAPEAGLRADAEVRVVLLAPHFQPAALAAARAVGSGLRLALLRFVENGAGIGALIEALSPSGHAEPPAREGAGFRSGLSPADLDLTAEERAEFENPEPE